MLGLLGLGNIGVLGIASLIGQGIGTMMSLRAQRQALAYEQMQARVLEKQYRDEADAVTLEMQAQELDRKRRYTQTLSENRALLSASGIDADSPSYRALLKANEKIYKQDINRLNVMGSEARVAKLREAEQARLSGRAAKQSYKAGISDTLGRNLMNMGSTFGEFNLLNRSED